MVNDQPPDQSTFPDELSLTIGVPHVAPVKVSGRLIAVTVNGKALKSSLICASKASEPLKPVWDTIKLKVILSPESTSVIGLAVLLACKNGSTMLALSALAVSLPPSQVKLTALFRLIPGLFSRLLMTIA